jgi:hypothetical protein
MKTLHQKVADKLERHPELLSVPLANIERWLANGHTAPHRLEQWRLIILRAQASEQGLHDLLAILRDAAEDAQRLRDYAPFAGVLTTEERRNSKPECAYHF